MIGVSSIGCEQSLRRYNLKANHNVFQKTSATVGVVSNHYEDTIWKQITTPSAATGTKKLLWAIITKIQSESKSQHFGKQLNCFVVVSNHYEDTIWKQITTVQVRFFTPVTLWAIITKIQSESKSQQTPIDQNAQLCCEQSLRRYNLKANHNREEEIAVADLLWAIITKIQSESKSQPRSCPKFCKYCCEQSLRRYNLKANHN